MRVEGIHAGSASALKSGAQKVDAISKSLQKQIENAQKQMQDLAKNEQMSPEDKMKKRQELQKQISDLNQQLRQHEMEVRRKQAEEARQKREREAQENGLDKQEKEREQKGGFSKDRMNAMLAADSAIKQASTGGGVVTRMEGEKHVLASEISTDRARGVNTAKKEERLSDLEKRMDDVIGTQIKTLAEANEKLDEVAEKENDEQEKDRDAKESKATGQAVDLKPDAGIAVPEDDAAMAEELARKTGKDQKPGQIIDERL